jgi:glycosyltransferase involved in cell wall biosynthesis
LKVSIVLPVYGASPFVAETIAALLINMESNDEVIIVFDRAEPHTVQRVIDALPRDFGFRLISSLDPGLVSALNVGIHASTRELIARIDADDLMLEGRLIEQVRVFEQNSSLVALGTQAIHVDEKGTVLGRTRLPLYSWQIKAELSLWNPLSHPTMMYKRQALLEVGGYNEGALAAEDFELARRLRSRGKIRNLSRTGIHYRIHRDQVTRTHRSRAAETMSQIIASGDPPKLSSAIALHIVNLYLFPNNRASALVSLWLFAKHRPFDACVILASKIVTSFSLSLANLFSPSRGKDNFSK